MQRNIFLSSKNISAEIFPFFVPGKTTKKKMEKKMKKKKKYEMKKIVLELIELILDEIRQNHKQ